MKNLRNLRNAFILILLIQTSFAQTIRKGPYLLYPLVNTEMTVLWQLTGAAACNLVWGTDLNYTSGTASVTNYGTDFQYKHTITNLTPGVVYYYKVSFATNNYTGSFRAAPPTTDTKLSFFVWGDTRDDAIDPEKVNTEINKQIAANPEYQTLIMHTGDWVGEDSEADWDNQFFNRAYPNNLKMHSTLPMMGAMGNHARYAISGAQSFRKYLPYDYGTGGLYYSYDYGPIHVAVVNQYSESYAEGSAQYTWLENDLKNSDKKWKFLVFHHPAYSCGGAHADNPTAKANLHPLCVQYNVSMVLAGHNHYYSRNVVDNVVHLTVGGGGANSYTPGSGTGVQKTVTGLSFVRIDIDGNNLNAYTITPTGTIADSYTLMNVDLGLPSVAITAPSNSQHYSTPQQITFSADAADAPGGTVSKVEFFVNGVSIGVDNNAPYSVNYTIPSNGNYVLKATVTDNELNTTSSQINISCGASPDNVLFNYDGVDLSFTPFGGSSWAKVANPQNAGINTSANVGTTVKSTTTWAGIFSPQLSSGKLDFSTKKFIKMKVLSPVIGDIVLKLEDFANASIIREITVTNTKINEWEELIFDCSTVSSGTYDRVTLFFDFGTPNVNTFYFDDMVQTNYVVTNIIPKTTERVEMRIIPNGQYGAFRVYSNVDLNNTPIEIFDITGQKIAIVSRVEGDDYTEINLGNQPTGVYIVRSLFNNKLVSGKIMLVK